MNRGDYDEQWVIWGDSAWDALMDQDYTETKREMRHGVVWCLMRKALDPNRKGTWHEGDIEVLDEGEGPSIIEQIERYNREQGR